MENKLQKINVAVLIILIIVIFNMCSKIEEMNNYIINVRNEVDSINSKINNINFDIDSINQQQQLVSEHRYEIENVNNKYVKAKAKVFVTFNKLYSQSKAYIIYGQKDTYQKVELEKIEGLIYKGELELSYDNNYKVQVVVEIDGKKEAQNLPELDLKDKLEAWVENNQSNES